MKITHCKLNKSIQNKLLEFFVLEVTARAAAYLLGIHANSAILFFRKIPKVISYHLSLEADEVFNVSKFHHERINHSELFAVKQNHINGIKNFWSQAKRILRKYNGIDRKNFPLFLKECEFRFNLGVPKEQLKILRKWCDI